MPFYHPHILLRSLPTVGLVALLAGFSGCELPGMKEAAQHIATPPLIPVPHEKPAEAPQELKVLKLYADVFALSDEVPRNRTLKQVLSETLERGLLLPTDPKTPFEPERSMTYGELSAWLAAFENAGQPSGAKYPAPEQLELGQVAETVPTSSPRLPVGLSVGETAFRLESTVTRQELAALYALLSNQADAVRKMPAGQLDRLSPGEASGTESFDQFKDYEAISPWAHKYVAVAYRDGVLQTVFGLSPEQLTLDEGLHPDKTLTRGEALLFLDLLQRREGKNLPPSTGGEGKESARNLSH